MMHWAPGCLETVSRKEATQGKQRHRQPQKKHSAYNQTAGGAFIKTFLFHEIMNEKKRASTEQAETNGP